MSSIPYSSFAARNQNGGDPGSFIWRGVSYAVCQAFTWGRKPLPAHQGQNMQHSNTKALESLQNLDSEVGLTCIFKT